MNAHRPSASDVRAGRRTIASIAPVLASLAAFGMSGCAARPPRPLTSSHPPTLTAAWVGKQTSEMSRIREITLAVTAEQNNVTGGTYTCTGVNSQCRGTFEEGNVVQGNLSAERFWLRVRYPDQSTCLFMSRPAASTVRVTGDYMCYQSAGLIEHGWWEAVRLPQ